MSQRKSQTSIYGTVALDTNLLNILLYGVQHTAELCLQRNGASLMRVNESTEIIYQKDEWCFRNIA